MVVVGKKEKVRIWLDSSDFNKAILREHYHVPTLEDEVPRLIGSKALFHLGRVIGILAGEVRRAELNNLYYAHPVWQI